MIMKRINKLTMIYNVLSEGRWNDH